MPHRVQRVIQPQRHTHFQDGRQLRLIIAMGQQGKLQTLVIAAGVQDAGQPGKIQRNGGCQRRTGHAHAQHRHKGNIQHNIGQAGDQQQQQGGPAVPQPAQNTGVHVIAKVAQGAQRRDPQVEHRIIKGICRDLHQPQQRRADKHCQYRDRDGAQIQKPYRRAHQHAQPIRIAAAHFLRNKDGRPVADAQKHAQQNFHWLCGGAHRRQRGGITEIAHHKGIHRAVKLLQDIAHTDRQGKQCRRFDDGAADHINFACMAGHAANHIPFTFPNVFIKLSLRSHHYKQLAVGSPFAKLNCPCGKFH